jgi:hypothetical protein
MSSPTVVLGAKHIFSSIMKSKDVMELTRVNVDIKSSLSFNVQAEVKSPSFEVKASAEGEETADTKKTRENINSIQKKIKNVDEISVGGRPPVDGNWKTWARTVRERPMPVRLELKAIWEYMNEDQAKAFLDALLVLYDLDLRVEPSYEILESMHFGLYQSDALAITSYSTSPNDKYRCLLSVENRTGIGIEYSAVWDGAQTEISAFFVTMLHGDVVPNKEEDLNSSYTTDGPGRSGIYHPFGQLSLDNPASPKFTVYDFDSLDIIEDPQSFSFLSADNLSNEADLIAGVIHPSGYSVNEVFGVRNGYEVEKENKRTFKIQFTNYMDPTQSPFSSVRPTFIAFPIWFDSKNDMPQRVEDITISVFCTGRYELCVSTTGCHRMWMKGSDGRGRNEYVKEIPGPVECFVRVGCDNREVLDCDLAADSLGFSFLALGSETTGIVHGHVDLDVSTDFKRVVGCDVLSNDDGSVLITFDEPYKALPSVVLTPYHEMKVFYDGVDQLIESSESPIELSIAVVEFVTTRSALVRVGQFEKGNDGTSFFSSSAFDFVVAGPPE